jgi:catechol 2,3-dioxygenase
MTPSLQLSSIHLRVSDLGRSVEFYAQKLGLAVIRQSAGRAEVGASARGSSFLILSEDRAAPRPTPAQAGLFHAALLFPERAALGAWLRSAASQGVEFDGFSDHGVSEAIYFSDPDGNGLEFYTDRPRAQWPFHNGELAMTTRALDVDSLLAAGNSGKNGNNAASAVENTRWGHLHLRATDLDRSEAFYRDALGLKLTQGTYPGARFLAADDYHHHLGINTWGHPRQPQTPGALGLVEATFAKSGETAPRVVHDPDGMALRVQPM